MGLLTILYRFFNLWVFCRAKPRPSKKARLDNPAGGTAAPEPEKTPGADALGREDTQNYLPPQDDTCAEERITDPASHTDPPVSPVRVEESIPPSGTADKPTGPLQSSDSKDDDVVITGIGHSEPGNTATLAKHTAKDEILAVKGKWDLDSSTYAALSAPDLYSGYLNRLYTSRDYEAGMIKMMKEKLEVTPLCFIPLQLSLSIFPNRDGKPDQAALTIKVRFRKPKAST